MYPKHDGKFFYMDLQHLETEKLDTYVMNFKGLAAKGQLPLEMDVIMTPGLQGLNFISPQCKKCLHGDDTVQFVNLTDRDAVDLGKLAFPKDIN